MTTAFVNGFICGLLEGIILILIVFYVKGG